MRKTTAMLAIFTALLWAQVSIPQGQVKATYAGQSVTVNLTVYAAPTALPFVCDDKIIAVGQATNCTYSLSGAAPVPITVLMGYGSSVSGPPTVTIPAGQTSISVSVVGVAPTASVVPVAWTVGAPTSAPGYHAYMVTPCGSDGWNLPAQEQVLIKPCLEPSVPVGASMSGPGQMVGPQEVK